MDFGHKIRELRKAAQLNQRELAEKVEIDFTYLSKVENGKMDPPSEDIIRKMATILQANVDDLLSLAKKFPKDLGKMLPNQPEAIQFLRMVEKKNLTKEQWQRIINSIKEK